MAEMKQDDRLKKGGNEAKESRGMSERSITENRELTDEQRLELLRGMGLQTILPDLPPIPGYHTVWLSSTNQRDSIGARMRLGYTPVRPEEVPSFNFHDTTVNKGTSLGDVVTINEMIAFKIPNELYQMYMEELHHRQPMLQEGKLKETADRIREQARAKGADVEVYDGMEELNQPVSRPIFG